MGFGRPVALLASGSVSSRWHRRGTSSWSSSLDSRLAARSSFRTESTRISQTRLGYCGLWGADSEFALVFVAAEFSFGCHVRAFGEGAAEIGQFSEGPHRGHSVRDSQDPASFFQDILVA